MGWVECSGVGGMGCVGWGGVDWDGESRVSGVARVGRVG